MFPFLIVAAAAILLEGCWKSQEPKKQAPPAPPPEPEVAPSSPIVISPPIFENTQGSAKLTPQELQELIRGMRACLEVQKSYGTACPPPEKLPKGCSCEEVQIPRVLDPETPIKFKRQMTPERPLNKGLITL
jgi:hypothetical protein